MSETVPGNASDEVKEQIDGRKSWMPWRSEITSVTQRVAKGVVGGRVNEEGKKEEGIRHT